VTAKRSPKASYSFTVTVTVVVSNFSEINLTLDSPPVMSGNVLDFCNVTAEFTRPSKPAEEKSLRLVFKLYPWGKTLTP
jgi:hypothetical protein